jgi:predicted Fe-Mo cluster-binding NifX family protein
MRIAIPVSEADGGIAEEFSGAPTFAVFDVHDDTRAVAYVGRQSLAEPGCGRTPGFLREHGVEVVMAHHISENAVNHLLEVGIVAIRNAPALTPDALIAHLVSGTLQATPPEVAMHGGGCGGGGGCGSCGSHAEAKPAAGACSQHSCDHAHDHAP